MQTKSISIFRLPTQLAVLAAILFNTACRTTSDSNSISVLEVPNDAYAVHLAAEKVFDEWVALHDGLPQTTARRWSGSTLPTNPSDDAAAAAGEPDHGSLIAHAPDATLTIETLRVASPRILTRVSVRIDPNSMSMKTATQETHDLLEKIKATLHALQ